MRERQNNPDFVADKNFAAPVPLQSAASEGSLQQHGVVGRSMDEEEKTRLQTQSLEGALPNMQAHVRVAAAPNLPESTRDAHLSTVVQKSSLQTARATTRNGAASSCYKPSESRRVRLYLRFCAAYFTATSNTSMDY